MHLSGVFVLIFVVFTLPGFHARKVLVCSSDGSHWLNLNALIEDLHSRGHNITVMRTSHSWYIKEKSPHYNSITIPTMEAIYENLVKSFVNSVLQIQRESASLWRFLKIRKVLIDLQSEGQRITCDILRSLFEDQKFMKTLQEAQYDVVLTDPNSGLGIMLAHYLRLPVVNIANGMAHFSIAPSPLSYVPSLWSGYSDRMDFIQRFKNMIIYGVTMFEEIAVINAPYQELCDKYFGTDVHFTTLVRSTDFWLLKTDFVFEFPRPTMPNVALIAGFQCKPPKPLPKDLEEFVQSSGEHGVIIISLGSLVRYLLKEIADEIASAFAQLPQKVIWSYEGYRPATLGNNTLLVNWIPQPDLLGHPKTKVFVGHGGINGLQEAIYHGVPVVGIPFFYDQFDNLNRLTERGAAKVVELAFLDRNVFLQALQEVLHTPSYKDNMKRLSSLHRDQPMNPLNRAIFWIEFVMRHKGATHLRTESYKMPWYIYHSVDVIFTLLAVFLLILLTVVAVVRYCCCRPCCKRKIKYD